MTFTTAHSNAGSLTHRARPRIETASPRMLVSFIFAEPWWELQVLLIDMTTGHVQFQYTDCELIYIFRCAWIFFCVFLVTSPFGPSCMDLAGLNVFPFRRRDASSDDKNSHSLSFVSPCVLSGQGQWGVQTRSGDGEHTTGTEHALSWYLLR